LQYFIAEAWKNTEENDKNSVAGNISIKYLFEWNRLKDLEIEMQLWKLELSLFTLRRYERRVDILIKMVLFWD
jgi:hypothetical protein